MATARRLINTTPEAAFTYLSDLTRHGEWAIHSLQLEQTSPGAVMQGATFRSRGQQFGVKVEDEVEVTQFRPPERLEFESTGKGGVFRHAFDFRPAEGGTVVTKHMDVRDMPRIYLFMRPFTEFVLSRRLAKDLRRIADRLEGGG